MRKLLALALVAALLSLGAVTALGATKSVKWKLDSQSTVKISKGSKVKWVWADSAPHNVKGPGFISSTSSSPGHAYTRKFSKRGKFTIVCGIHGSSMKTVVKVS
jgi:plastocyanin